MVELDTGPVKPLEQIKSKKYHEKYMDSGHDVFLVGIEFSKDDRNIKSFEWIRASLNKKLKTKEY